MQSYLKSYGQSSRLTSYVLDPFHTADGHYGLGQKNKVNDPDDVSLLYKFKTRAFFEEEGKFKEFLNQTSEKGEEVWFLFNRSYWFRV